MTTQQIIDKINSDLADNTTQAITEGVMREVLKEITNHASKGMITVGDDDGDDYSNLETAIESGARYIKLRKNFITTKALTLTNSLTIISDKYENNYIKFIENYTWTGMPAVRVNFVGLNLVFDFTGFRAIDVPRSSFENCHLTFFPTVGSGSGIRGEIYMNDCSVFLPDKDFNAISADSTYIHIINTKFFGGGASSKNAIYAASGGIIIMDNCTTSPTNFEEDSIFIQAIGSTLLLSNSNIYSVSAGNAKITNCNFYNRVNIGTSPGSALISNCNIAGIFQTHKDNTIVRGNEIGGFVDIVGDDCIIIGNRFAGEIDFLGNDYIIANNEFLDVLYFTHTNHIVAGNKGIDIAYTEAGIFSDGDTGMVTNKLWNAVIASTNSQTNPDAGANAVVISSDESKAYDRKSFIVSSVGCEGANNDKYDTCIISSRYIKQSTNYSLALGYSSSGPAATANQTIRLESVGGIGRFEGGTSTSGFDFAEYMESKSGEAIALGTLVELEGEKIVPANGKAIGVISKTASHIGNASDLKWAGRYLRDEWGGYIYEEIPDPDWEPNKKGNETEEDRPLISVRKENPNYVRDENYIPRSERPEWNIVGLLGQVYVRTGEDLQAGDFIIAENGHGKKSNIETNIQVMKMTKKFDGKYGIAFCLIK
jgi:hypothetical protein